MKMAVGNIAFSVENSHLGAFITMVFVENIFHITSFITNVNI